MVINFFYGQIHQTITLNNFTLPHNRYFYFTLEFYQVQFYNLCLFNRGNILFSFIQLLNLRFYRVIPIKIYLNQPPLSVNVSWIHLTCSSKPLQGVVIETSSKGGHYDILASRLFYDGELSTPSTFICEVCIPTTEYCRRKRLVYYPGVPYYRMFSKSSRVTYYQ